MSQDEINLLFDVGSHERIFQYPSKDLTVRHHVADALVSAVHYIKISPVEGDIAEFGVGSGWTSAVIARAMATVKDRNLGEKYTRCLHLFDSFKGLPVSASPVDQDAPLVSKGIWAAGSCNWDLDPEELSLYLKRVSGTTEMAIYPGWFEDCLKAAGFPRKLAMIHLDCDLYEPTLTVLDFLFSRRLIQPGAILLFDDWHCNASAPQLGQIRAWSEIVQRFEVDVHELGYYPPMGHRVIVNGYRSGTSKSVFS
jgi:hypothetical protein